SAEFHSDSPQSPVAERAQHPVGPFLTRYPFRLPFVGKKYVAMAQNLQVLRLCQPAHVRLHVDRDMAAAAPKSEQQRLIDFAVGCAREMNMPRPAQLLQRLGLEQLACQQPVRTVVAEKRTIFSRRNTDSQAGSLRR